MYKIRPTAKFQKDLKRVKRRGFDISLLTERFISVISRERFDYTKWQQKRFANMKSDEFNQAAIAYTKENPFRRKESSEKMKIKG